jgi:glycosyltransferase involved in cell wall biosynthesis
MNEFMNNIELSFCIPTYNRAQIVNGLVKELLLCNDQNIEVVVLDNGSTDETLSILRAIKDERLFVYSNGENKGALFNMVNVLNKGRGRFLVYSTDQDHVDNTKINQFKLFLLQQSNLAGGYCTFNPISEFKYEIFTKGYQAINKIAYQGRHPTGYFFNRSMLHSIKFVERFSDYNFVDLFPLEFAFAELCLLGDGAIYHGPIFTPETGEMVVKHKSSTTSGKSKNAFFSPESRLKLAINYTKHISTLQLLTRERDMLIINTFFNGLVAATLGYRTILRSNDLCLHYYMDCREMKIIELISISLNFYKQFVNATKSVWGREFLGRFRFKVRIFVRIFLKMVSRASKYLFIRQVR